MCYFSFPFYETNVRRFCSDRNLTPTWMFVWLVHLHTLCGQ